MVMTDMGKGLENGKDLIITGIISTFLSLISKRYLKRFYVHSLWREYGWLFGISRIFFWSYARVRIKRRTKVCKRANYKNRVLMSYLNS